MADPQKAPPMPQQQQVPPPEYQPPAYPQQPPPPPQGYVQQPQQAYVPRPPQQYGQQQNVHQIVNYPQTQQLVATQPSSTTVIIPGGNCPNCQIGMITEDFSICGVLWAVLCFPWGLICLFTMKDRKCSHCGRCYDF